MIDLIRRSDAIEAVWKLDKDANEYVVDDAKEIHGYCTAIGVCVGELSTLPSADAVQGWITDRNPTEDGTYIVTIADEDDSFVCELHYGKPLMPICSVNAPCWYDSDDEFGDCPYEDIIAWMPLPEPYKGGDSE